MNSADPIPVLQQRRILRMRVDATTYDRATAQILNWAQQGEHRYVCVANVHMAMEVYDSPRFAQIVDRADLVTPDGMPLVWALRWFGVPDAERVYGPKLVLCVCAAAAKERVSIGLYGGTPASLDEFVKFLESSFPQIEIVCRIAPPFRPLTPEEEADYRQQIIDSGAQILFVGIGCPKQEDWMAAQTSRIPAVMLGVGAAFDFHSGRVKQAPIWMQNSGLEWLFRLYREPRRLWQRYVYNNPRFIVFLGYQWLTERMHRKSGIENSADGRSSKAK
jgi:N-acetylglucosaminyldiphosphoundecaprenol N-acetyl-beta-D-mannosaminyltransferase